ncbi:paraquat-inducible protein A [Thalassococcus lentus]|uniref:Paraquat-inducible protein A n=1 Tax=Thalassococcus lentus TaxID=1210524 RepID=A0ABT4XTI6_9RHOB|nr:paraquat-inducible protein A [Thalassococcus lentus]MDA7425286.1 paraquat-inducible protein A [Thalassococcus lentus]
MSRSGPSLFDRAGRLGRICALGNALLLLALPISWTLPLLKQTAFIWLESKFSVLQGAMTLFSEDLFLFLVLVVFAMIVPMLKTALYTYLWFAPFQKSPRLYFAGSVMAKLSMIDVMVAAVLIVAVKGIGVGKVAAEPGLYLFSALVLFSMLVSVVTDISAKRAHLA